MSNIYKKMSDVMKEIGYVGKDQKNQAQGFKFRGIDQFVNTLYPALCKHGVFMTPRCVKETSELREVTRSSGKAGLDKHVQIMMEYDFYAEDGTKVTVGPVPAEGFDSGDKATNKALSAALKYALIQTFSVPTEDMAEADFDSPELGKPTGGIDFKSKLTTKTLPPVNGNQLIKEVVNEINVVTAAENKAASPKKETPKAQPAVAAKVNAGW